MTETQGDGGPFFFATEPPPSAIAIDEDIYVTITAAHPLFPGEAQIVDIILSADMASHLIAALSGAVGIAAKDTTNSPPH
jgi:hypothetical protein